MNNTSLVSAYAILDRTSDFFRSGTRELLSTQDKQSIESYLTRVYSFIKDVEGLSNSTADLAAFIGEIKRDSTTSDLFKHKEDLASTFYTLSVEVKMDIIVYLSDNEFDMMTGMEPTLIEMADFAIKNGYYFGL